MHTSFPGDGFGQMVMAFIAIIFVIIIGTIIFRAVQGLSEWSHNNSQPVLIVPAKVVTKRQNVSVHQHHHHHDNGHVHSHDSTSTQYFATFELEGGARLELQISGRESGLLAEGDTGELTYQGTRYNGFRRLSQSGTGETGTA
jgi:hypothetical protein